MRREQVVHFRFEAGPLLSNYFHRTPPIGTYFQTTSVEGSVLLLACARLRTAFPSDVVLVVLRKNNEE